VQIKDIESLATGFFKTGFAANTEGPPAPQGLSASASETVVGKAAEEAIYNVSGD